MGTHFKGNIDQVTVLDTWIKLSRAKISIDRFIRSTIENNKLTIAQFGVLEILHHLGRQNQKAIGTKLLWSPGNVVMVVDNLVRDGLIRRVKNPRDRRSHLIELLPAGEKLIIKVFAAHLEDLVEVFSFLDLTEVKLLGRLSKKLGLGVNDRYMKKKGNK